MCGRYTESRALQEIQDRFAPDVIGYELDLAPRYNLAPTQRAPILRKIDGKRELTQLVWGLVPFWAKDKSIGSRMINARVETVTEKPAYRAAFRKRRCLVIADGFYEWKREEDRKSPWYFCRKDRGLFAFAGLWEQWMGDGDALETFTILTTDANDLVKEVHPRMPVILRLDQEDPWLDLEKTDLAPLEASEMMSWPVSKAVNSPKNDGPHLVEAAVS
ncbi:SOS response-associated peptidase [Fodinicurvata fenggangensis]|uniref:SOS response-associated peptidase n=1 Tax=Fodinicurvata fenggangensis TaxID=1121830 RepID=UPI00047BD5F4|nr:SOS response-associated peptidase [Fodinicurvata fenggangensis]